MVFGQAAHARGTNFLANTGFPSINGVSSCSGCHTNSASNWNGKTRAGANIAKPDVKVTGPTSISSTQATVSLSVSGLAASLSDYGSATSKNRSFHWRYRVNGGPTIVDKSNSATASSVNVGTSGNPSIEYCIIEAVTKAQSGVRNLRCDTINITRNAANTAPDITQVSPTGPLNLTDGDTETVSITASDNGPNSELRHSASSNNSAVATVSGGGSGSSRTFTITAKGAGTATITFTVKDKNGVSSALSDAETVTVNVSAANSAPNIVTVSPNGTIDLTDGDTESVTVTASDDGPNNQLVHSASSNKNSVATVSGGGSGASRTFTITAQGEGTATITFRVRDLNGGTGNLTDTDTVTVTVGAANSAPSITSVSQSSPINLTDGDTQSVTVTGTDDGPNSQLRHSASSSDTGVATVSGGGSGASRSFTITAKAVGSATITFRLRDLSGGSGHLSDTETVVVNVSEVPNSAPTISSINPSGSINLEAGGTRSVTVTATDDGPDSQLVHSASSNRNSVARVTGGGSGSTETFSVEAIGPGNATLTFRVKDKNGGSGSKQDTETINVVVTAANVAPEITSRSPGGTINLETTDSPLTVTLNVDDEDTGSLDYSSQSGDTSVVTVSGGSGGAYQFRPRGAGQTTVTLRVEDDEGLSDTETVTVRVAEPAATNEPPRITSRNPGGSISLVTSAGPLTVTLSVDDESTGSLDFSRSVANTSVVTVSGGSGGAYQFQARGVGTTTVTLTVEDNGGLTDSETVTVTVTEPAPTNQAPQITGISPSNGATVFAGETLSVTVTATDDSAESLNFEASSNDNSVASVTGGANGNFSIAGVSPGSAVISFTVTDSEGESDDQTLNITVEAIPEVNQAPVINSLSPGNAISLLTTDNPVSVSMSVSDENTGSLQYSSQVDNASVVSVSGGSGGNFTIAPQASGQATVTFRVEDSEGLSDTITVTVNVSEPAAANQAPVINSVSPSESIGLVVGESVALAISTSDESPSSLSYLAASANESVATVNVGGGGNFTVQAQGPGATQVTLTATDSDGLAASIGISVAVSAQTIAPVANDDQFVLSADSSSELLNVLANDSDADGQSLSIVLNSDLSALGGGLVVQDNQILYSAPANLGAEDSFTYTVLDSDQLSSNTATVNIVPSDGDGDGVFDNADNCRILANSDQSNLDGDALGDACDADPDGDGILGEAGRPFTTGKSLVEGVCLDCHREGVAGAPQFGDNEAWAQRVQEAGGIEVLLESVTNGKGAMPAWGQIYTARELVQGLLYMTGLEDPLLSENFFDSDLDGVDNLNDNCVNFANADQADSNSNSVGDACEPDVNGDGVLDYSMSLLVFQDTASGRQQGSLVATAAGTVTIAARTRAGLTGLSYDWSESSPEFLGLLSSGTDGELVTLEPSRAGIFSGKVSISGGGITATGRTRLVVVDATAGLDLTDSDGDGYPAHLDNNNLNANRVPAETNGGNQASILFSDNQISLGELALFNAAENNFESAGAILNETELLAAAQARYPDVVAESDEVVATSIGVFDTQIGELDGSTATLTMKLRGNVPLAAKLRLYQPGVGDWIDFDASGSDSIASAPETSTGCPANTSANFSSGLNAGHGCVRLRLTDGGQNDSDKQQDGVVSLVGAIGSVLSDDQNGSGNEPDVVDLNPTKGGGGSVRWMELVILGFMFIRMKLMIMIAGFGVRQRRTGVVSRRVG